jgi:dipeptidyl aminopeptidase/acylaminoacyl peptidase
MARAQSGLPVQWLYTPVVSAGSVAYSPDGSLVALGGESGIQIYATSTRSLVTCLSTGYSSNGLAFLPDGKTLATSSGSTITLWNFATGQQVGALHGTSASIISFAISPDGSSATACETNMPRIFQIPSATIDTWSILDQKLHTSVTKSSERLSGIAYSPDGSSIAICGNFGSPILQILDASTLNPITSLSTTATYLNSVAFSPDGKTLAAAGSGRDSTTQASIPILELWNVSTGMLGASLKSSLGSANTVSFSPDGKMLAAGGSIGQYSGDIELWNVATGALTTTLSGNPSGAIYALAFSQDGKSIAAPQASQAPNNGPGYTLLDLWNVSTGDLVAGINTQIYNSATSLALSPDGATLAVCGVRIDPTSLVQGSWIGLWDTKTGTLRSSITPSSHASSVAISPDGKLLADCGYALSSDGSYGPLLEIWNLQTGTLIQDLPSTISNITSISFTADSSMLAAAGWMNSNGGSNGVIEVWSVSSGKQIASLPTRISQTAISIACSPVGSTLAACGTAYSFLGYSYGVVELWDIPSQSLISSLDTGILDVATVAFSPDGKMVADGGQRFVGGNSGFVDGLELWDISSSDPILLSSFPSIPVFGGVDSIAFSPDGTTVFAGALTGLGAFSVGDYALLGSYPGSGASALAITPDGGSLALLNQVSGVEVASNPFNVSIPVASLVLDPNSVVGGNWLTGSVTLSAPAPATGLGLKLTSNNPKATVPGLLEFSAGATTATFTVNTTGVAKLSTATITAGFGNLSQSATLSIFPTTLGALGISPASSEGGQLEWGVAALDGLAPEGGIVVSLKSSDPIATVPASVSIPAGQQSTLFKIATVGVKVKTTVLITGAYKGVTQSSSFVLNPNTISSVGIVPDVVFGGTSCTGAFAIQGTAPPGGESVKLVSNSPAVIVPASVLIPGGKSSGTFSVRTVPVTAQAIATVTLTCGGTPVTTYVVVNPPKLASLTLKPTSVKGGKNSIGTVTFGSPAPRGGLAISLASSDSSATTPKSVTIPPGATSATFTVRTSKVSSPTTATITATYGGLSQSATLTIS